MKFREKLALRILEKSDLTYEVEMPPELPDVVTNGHRLTYLRRASADRYNVINERLELHETDPDLISSRLKDFPGYHAPAIDFDFPASLVPSTTEDHYHLYISKPVTWRRYRKLLKALYRAGLIEQGFYRIARIRKQTLLFLPGKKHGQRGVGSQPATHQIVHR